MKTHTEKIPKALLPLKNKPLIEWILQAMKEAGIKEIGIVSGYKRELLAKYGLVEFYNSRWAETNMVSSLGCAETWLQNEPLIISYSDIFYNSNAIQLLMHCKADLAVTYDPNWLEMWKKRFAEPLLDAETFRFDKRGILQEIGNKPLSLEEVQGQYMGLLRFTPKGWAEVSRIRSFLTPDERDKMHMTGTLQYLIKAGRIQIKAVVYQGMWGEIDSENDISVYENR